MSSLRCVTILSKDAGTDALIYLLQLKPATQLNFIVELDQWLAVAKEIRRGRCNVINLALTILRETRSEATEAIQMDYNLEYLFLQLQDGFTDKVGVALAEASRSTKLSVLSTCPLTP